MALKARRRGTLSPTPAPATEPHMPFDMQLQAAKEAIALPNFKRDDLLGMALTEPSNLNQSDLLATERSLRQSREKTSALLFLRYFLSWILIHPLINLV